MATMRPEDHSKAMLPGPAPRQDAWEVIGPGGGGTMISPTISPHDPRIVLEHCDMTGAYITVDGGLSWRMFNLRTVVQTFAFDPRDPKVIYAGNRALWRSEDTGRTWGMVFPDPAKNTVEHMIGDHADFMLSSDDPAYETGMSIRAIAVDPDDSDRIYLGIAGENPALLLSQDRGKTWVRLTEFEDPIRAVHLHHRRVYVVTGSGVHRQVGQSWQRFAAPSGGVDEIAIGSRSDAEEPVMYAISSGSEVYRSEDGGRTWQSLTKHILRGITVSDEPPTFRSVACSQQNPDTAYVGFRDAILDDGRMYSGIAKTANGGATWTIVLKECDGPAANMDVSWIEARAVDGSPNIWFDPPYTMGVAPADPNLCYATDLFCTYRTLDGGATWQQVNSVCAGGDHWTTRGLDVTTCYGVHFDPFDANHVFISYTDIGLFQSADGGASWFGATEGIPNAWRNTTYWIAFDPDVKGLIWGAFALNHDLPRPKMWRGGDPDRYKGGVAVSTDGGRSWTLSNSGMHATAVTHILLDPNSPVGKRTLYACGFGRGVYKSTDNGKTWMLKRAGVEKRQPFAWRLIPDNAATLYLIVARRAMKGGAATKKTAPSTGPRMALSSGQRWPCRKAATGQLASQLTRRMAIGSTWPPGACSDGLTTRAEVSFFRRIAARPGRASSMRRSMSTM